MLILLAALVLGCDGEPVDTGGPPDADGDGWADAVDCEPQDASASPGADELCNGRDDDCDGEVDEEAVDAETWFADADEDGFGDPEVSTLACEQPSAWVADDTDCDDTRAEVHPEAEEVCDNGLDDDCDGTAGDCAWTEALGWEERTGEWSSEGLGAHLSAGEAGLLVSDADSAWLVSEPAVLGTEPRLTGAPGALLVLGQDVVVADPWADEAGVVWVHAAPTSQGQAGVGALVTLQGEAAGDLAGVGLAAGDLDRDGSLELLVGATGVSGERLGMGTVLNGAVYLIPGTELEGELALGDADAGILGTDGEVYLGAPGSIALADLTGDDRLDTIVGGWGYDSGAGAAWVHMGAGYLWDGWVCSCDGDSEFQGPEGSLAGATVARADLDDDGRHDLILGGPGGDGALWVFYGSAAGWGPFVSVGEADLSLSGDVADGALATALHADGDIDGDGVEDLLVGWPGHGDGAGAVVLLPGGSRGSLAASDLPRVEGPPGGALGTSVLAWNRSGEDGVDVVAGAPGAGVVLLFEPPGM